MFESCPGSQLTPEISDGFWSTNEISSCFASSTGAGFVPLGPAAGLRFPRGLHRRSDPKATRQHDRQDSGRLYDQPRTARALRFSHAVLASKSSAFASCFTSRGGGPRSHSRVNSSLGPIQSAWYIGGESFLILPERTCPRSHA